MADEEGVFRRRERVVRARKFLGEAMPGVQLMELPSDGTKVWTVMVGPSRALPVRVGQWVVYDEDSRFCEVVDDRVFAEQYEPSSHASLGIKDNPPVRTIILDQLAMMLGLAQKRPATKAQRDRLARLLDGIDAMDDKPVSPLRS